MLPYSFTGAQYSGSGIDVTAQLKSMSATVIALLMNCKTNLTTMPLIRS